MKWRWPRRKTDPGVVPSEKCFVVDSEMHRTEELRPDVLGAPSEGEIRDDIPHDPWRPSRTLGPINYRGGR